MGVKNLKHLLISIPKCIELNSKSKPKLILILGLGLGDGYSYTLEETGRIFKVTRERIRQIESKALKKLQHHTRAIHLKGFVDIDDTSPLPVIEDEPVDVEDASLL